MYNEKLEQLIDAALTDGELNEKEKQILFKKAMVMGIDLDEFEMVLDARLTKLQQEKKAKEQEAAPKSNKFGDVKKCPACGAIVQSYQGVCLECGYAFENIEANSSSRKFFDTIDKLTREGENNSILKSLSQSFSGGGTKTKIDNFIKHFPIPNTKADLMEFIITMKSKMSDSHSPYSDSYRIKYKECIDKAKLLFPNDKDFEPLLLADKKIGWWKSQSTMTKTFIAVGGMFIVNILLLFLVGLFDKQTDTSSKTKVLSTYSNEITQAVIAGNTHKAVELFLVSDETDNKMASFIVDACLSDENLDDALRIASAVNAEYDDNISTKLYEYCLNHGNYEKAKDIYQTAYDYNRFNGKYIKDVVVSLCENGEKEEAERFLNIHKDEITKGDELGKPKKVVKDIAKIIESY